jgi:hypothetical protein
MTFSSAISISGLMHVLLSTAPLVVVDSQVGEQATDLAGPLASVLGPSATLVSRRLPVGLTAVPSSSAEEIHEARAHIEQGCGVPSASAVDAQSKLDRAIDVLHRPPPESLLDPEIASGRLLLRAHLCRVWLAFPDHSDSYPHLKSFSLRGANSPDLKAWNAASLALFGDFPKLIRPEAREKFLPGASWPPLSEPEPLALSDSGRLRSTILLNIRIVDEQTGTDDDSDTESEPAAKSADSAKILLDGRERGRAPLRTFVAPGEHWLQMTRASYRSQWLSFRVDEGNPANVALDLDLIAHLSDEPAPKLVFADESDADEEAELLAGKLAKAADVKIALLVRSRADQIELESVTVSGLPMQRWRGPANEALAAAPALLAAPPPSNHAPGALNEAGEHELSSVGIGAVRMVVKSADARSHEIDLVTRRPELDVPRICETPCTVRLLPGPVQLTIDDDELSTLQVTHLGLQVLVDAPHQNLRKAGQTLAAVGLGGFLFGSAGLILSVSQLNDAKSRGFAIGSAVTGIVGALSMGAGLTMFAFTKPVSVSTQPLNDPTP